MNERLLMVAATGICGPVYTNLQDARRAVEKYVGSVWHAEATLWLSAADQLESPKLKAECEAHAQTKRALDHAKQMMAALTDQRVLSAVDASIKSGGHEVVPKSELDRVSRERDDALETIRVLRLRIDGILDVVWKDLPRE